MLPEAYQRKKIGLDQCTGCGACAQLCAMHVISMQENDEGFLYPEIDYEKCVRCGRCVTVCPVLSPLPGKEKVEAALYSGYEKTLQYQERCSSGGIFGLLADKVLRNGGVVFGAAYDPSIKTVVHISSDEVDLNDILRSKYVQSRTGDVYHKVEEALNEAERQVLFCGTPCQVEGLLAFLKKDYENLITVDFVCHGVPSPGIFRAMLYAEEKKYGAKIENITFREKDPDGKGEEHLYLYLSDGRKIAYKSLDHYYYYLFLYNGTLRRSCMNCTRPENHRADLTLADDWLQKWEKDPRIGVSLIRINTKKGERVFECLRNELVIHAVAPEERAITAQAHHYSFKNRKQVFKKYHRTQGIAMLDKVYRRIRSRNESRKRLKRVLSRCYRMVFPRRNNDGGR